MVKSTCFNLPKKMSTEVILCSNTCDVQAIPLGHPESSYMGTQEASCILLSHYQ